MLSAIVQAETEKIIFCFVGRYPQSKVKRNPVLAFCEPRNPQSHRGVGPYGSEAVIRNPKSEIELGLPLNSAIRNPQSAIELGLPLNSAIRNPKSAIELGLPLNSAIRNPKSAIELGVQ
ncbi:MAG: hypothetical protein AB1585_14920 [Thermodesulfobacteriota bacterium]